MKVIFLDTEFTGEHQHTTLVSLGMVTLEGESLYVTLNDYDRDQVTDWLKQNVLDLIDETQSISRPEAYAAISRWLSDYAGTDQVRLVSAGLGIDVTLLFQLWEFARPDLKYFHGLHCLPRAINHTAHLDLNTMFSIAGVDPSLRREAFLDEPLEGHRHNALFDARVVRACFLKLLRDYPAFGHLKPL